MKEGKQIIMSNVNVITLGRGDDKWVNLMYHLQNSTNGAFEISFADREEAKSACKSMSAVVSRRPTWFHLVVFQRGCSVYVIDTKLMQKAVLR